MNTPIEYETPQLAPWPIGTRLQYIGPYISGHTNGDGETVWDHYPGVHYTVIGIHEPGGVDRIYDEEECEWRRVVYHGWSTMQSDLDPECRALKGYDVGDTNQFRVLT